MTDPWPNPPHGGQYPYGGQPAQRSWPGLPPPQQSWPGPPPQQSWPEQPPYGHAPFVPPPRRRRRGLIIGGVLAAVVAVLLVAGVAFVLLDDDTTKPTAQGRAKQYAEPADVCALLEAPLVEGWAGTPTSKEAENTKFSAELGGDVKGCAADVKLQTLNTVKLFVAASGHAKDRYGYTVDVYKAIPSAITKQATGLGAGATGFTQQGNDKRRIQAGLVTYDNNLFVEVRFLAGGTRPWNPDEVQRHLADVARGVMSKLSSA